MLDFVFSYTISTKLVNDYLLPSLSRVSPQSDLREVCLGSYHKLACSILNWKVYMMASPE